MKRLLLTLLMIAALLLLSKPVNAQSKVVTGVIRADSQGDVVLEHSAYLGKTLLPAGLYRVHSHGSGPDQQIHFEREITLSVVHPESSSVVVYNEAGRVDCTAERLPKKSGETILHYVEENGVMRIVSVDIQGESESHGL